jgi:NAD(P)-dependent dehydrogenase (short-subunit alcohol dehydrogenase family)
MSKYELKTSIENKVVLITGGSKGLGLECALAFAEFGARIAIVARNKEQIRSAVEQLKQAGASDAIGIAKDFSSMEQISSAYQEVIDAFGKIDVVANSAGVNQPTAAIEMTEEIWDKILDVNLKGTFFSCQEAAKVMMKNNGGKIINISSQMGFVGYYDRAAYCASKGGLEMMTKALAIEWAKYNIHINTVAPTFIETPLTEGMFKNQDFYNDVVSRIPLGRVGVPEDVVGAVLYLASDMSNLVTGTDIKVDGGWTAW